MTARAPGTPIICAIESARGVLAAQEIAAAPGVRFLAMGGVDLQRDLNTSGGNLQTLYARSHLVLASRAAGIEPPIDSVFPDAATTMTDFVIRRSSPGRWASSASRRSIRVSSRSCTRCSPRRMPRSPGHETVLAGFEAADGGGFALPTGEFVDLPVADRARRLLEIAGLPAMTVGRSAPVTTVVTTRRASPTVRQVSSSARSGPAERWRLAVRWAAIVLATLVTSALLSLLEVPSPALFGGLLTGMIFALTSRRPIVLHPVVNSGAQAVIGVVVGGLCWN